MFLCVHPVLRRVKKSNNGFSGAFGGLLASGLSRIPRWGIIHTWRNIFFFEGLISVMLAVTAYFILPSSPETATFLPEAERQVAVARIARDLKSRKIESLNMRYVKRAMFNLNTFLMCLASFCSLLTMNSMALFVPSLLNAMGYSGIHSQLLSVPPYAWSAIVCVTVTILSDRTRRRGMWILVVMPFTAIGFAILLSVDTIGVRYFALFFCLMGAFTASPMFLAWTVDNSAGHTTRAIAAATVVGFGSIGGILATWTYLLADAPRYITGHALNLSFACLCILLVVAAIINLKRENSIKAKGGRDARVHGLTEEEVADLGHLHPEFKFTL